MNAVVSSRSPGFDYSPAAVQTVRRSFVVTVEHGLHARPCALLVKTLHPFRLSVEVEVNGENASGNSILGLMSLGAGCGSKMSVTIVGAAAPEAMAAVEYLFQTRFEEAYTGDPWKTKVVSPQIQGAGSSLPSSTSRLRVRPPQ
jgi:phosphotransferase system HPr (HPr) family protein